MKIGDHSQRFPPIRAMFRLVDDRPLSMPNSSNKRAVGALVLTELIEDELKPAGKVVSSIGLIIVIGAHLWRVVSGTARAGDLVQVVDSEDRAPEMRSPEIHTETAR